MMGLAFNQTTRFSLFSAETEEKAENAMNYSYLRYLIHLQISILRLLITVQ